MKERRAKLLNPAHWVSLKPFGIGAVTLEKVG